MGRKTLSQVSEVDDGGEDEGDDADDGRVVALTLVKEDAANLVENLILQ